MNIRPILFVLTSFVTLLLMAQTPAVSASTNAPATHSPSDANPVQPAGHSRV